MLADLAAAWALLSEAHYNLATIRELRIVGFDCPTTWSLVKFVLSGRLLWRFHRLNLLRIIALAIDVEVLLLSCNLALPVPNDLLLLFSSFLG